MQQSALAMGSGSSFLTPLQNQVLLQIRSDPSPSGISLPQLIRNMDKIASEGEVRSAVDFFLSEGHIYTTIDDMHFKSTDTD